MSLPQAKEEALLTGEELLRLPDLGPCELVNGKIVPMAPTRPEHGDAENNLAYHLTTWARGGRYGKVWTGEVGIYIRRNPDTVRAPDVIFISHDRLARRRGPGFLDVPPELVVEVLSPTDRWAQVKVKLGDYFSAGVDRVWVVDPEARKVFAYRSPSESQTFEIGEILTDKDLLPGFSLPVAEIFFD